MTYYDRLYDETEQSQVRFVGFTSETTRYDFAIVYTNMFFGKALVVDMQMGRSALLSVDDIDNVDYLQRYFHIKDDEEMEALAVFFKSILPVLPQENQY